MRPRSILIQARHPRSMRKLRLHRMENQILGLSAGKWFFPLAFFIASLAWVHYKKNPTHYFGKIPTFSRENALKIIQAFLLLFIFSIALDQFVSFFNLDDTQAVQSTISQLLTAPLFSVIFLMAFVALAEEMFFRGILFKELGKWPAILLFGFAHSGYGSAIEVIGALGAGIILVYARQKNKSIFPGFVAHALYNLAAIFLITY